MSKPIRLNEKQIAVIVKDFMERLTDYKMSDKTIDLSYKVPEFQDNPRATLVFEPIAYSKMLALVNGIDTEVAWHGTVERDGSKFTIKDILVYPQEVAGATVNTDQEEYEKWLYGLEDEQFNALRMQGHSHVNMGTSPSSVDLSHQERIVEQLEDGMYYIFLIWNKRNSYTVRIFDMETNTLYENNDVDIFIGDTSLDADTFIRDAKAMLKEKKYSYVSSSKKSDKKEWDPLKDFFDRYE